MREEVVLPLSGQRLAVERDRDGGLWLTRGPADGPGRIRRRLRPRPVCGAQFGRSQGGSDEPACADGNAWFGLTYGLSAGRVEVEAIGHDRTARSVPVHRLGPTFSEFWFAEATGDVQTLRVTIDGHVQEGSLHEGQIASLARRYGSWPPRE